MTQEQVFMVEMEEKLAKDADGSYRNAVRKQLTDFDLQLKHRIDAGLAPVDFEKIKRLKQAVETAGKVMESL